MSDTASVKTDGMMRATPGLSMKPSWRTSLVARAMMSPTCWRLWKVWLLPSRLMTNSSRASRSRRWASSSSDQALMIWSTARASPAASTSSASGSSAARLPTPDRTRSKARPISSGGAAISALLISEPATATIGSHG
jgi:hypothetical protein